MKLFTLDITIILLLHLNLFSVNQKANLGDLIRNLTRIFPRVLGTITVDNTSGTMTVI